MRDPKPMVDTNILVYAHNQDSPYFNQARSVLTGLIDKGGFCLTSLILFEFFSVITNGRKIEAPLSPDTGLSIIDDMHESQLIHIMESHDDLGFFQWLRSYSDSTKRYQIYDASIGYIMFQNQISELYTNNTKGFKKFDFIKAINPFESSSPSSKLHAPCYIPYARQSIDEKDVAAVCSVLRSQWLTTGPNVGEFEQAIAGYVGAKYAVAISSGTAALHLACLTCGLEPGDEGVTSPITFVASANAIVYCGASLRFGDIDPRTYNISVNDLEKSITKKTRVLIPVHFAGQSCDMEAIQQIRKDAEKKYGHKVCIIEDACHALGSLYKDKKVGSCEFSDMTVMSFHPVKHITTGEGGVVFTNDEDLYEKLKRFRSHGITSNPEEFVYDHLAFQPSANPWYYEQQRLGFNYRITDIQCALGLSQLKKLDMFRKRRREIVNIYNEAFENIKYLQTPFEATECDSNFHLYVLLFDFEKMGTDRAQFMFELKEKGIQTQVHYIPVHLQPYFRRSFGTKEGDCPNAEQYYQKCLSIPLYPAMTELDIEKVSHEIGNIVEGSI